MVENKNIEDYKEKIGFIFIIIIVSISLLFSLDRNPNTGAITIDAMVLIWGFFIAIAMYIVLSYRKYSGTFFPKTRFCVNCGRSIPFEAVICPYCRHDYEK